MLIVPVDLGSSSSLYLCYRESHGNRMGWLNSALSFWNYFLNFTQNLRAKVIQQLKTLVNCKTYFCIYLIHFPSYKNKKKWSKKSPYHVKSDKTLTSKWRWKAQLQTVFLTAARRPSQAPRPAQVPGQVGWRCSGSWFRASLLSLAGLKAEGFLLQPALL